jgi:hypothetical protein
MMTKITTITGLALLAACGLASVAEQEAAAQSRVAAKPLTLAGLRIGMPEAEVRAILARDGWKVETFPGKDWANTVETERRRQRGASTFDLPLRGIETVRATKTDETLVVEMRPVPAGASVKDVAYEAPMAGRTVDQLRMQMVQRYGRPDVAAPSALDMAWCSGGERCRTALGTMKPALSVKEDSYHKLRMHLSDGVESDQSWQRSVQRAAGGGGAEPSF